MKTRRYARIGVALAVVLAAGSAQGDILFHPEPIDDVLVNPYTGWVPWAKWGPYPQPHSMVYAGLTWRELEPVKGSFDWAGFESLNQFDTWGVRGVKINLRFILDYPGEPGHMDIPDWLHGAIGGDGTHYDTVEIGGGFSPNYDHPILIAEHERVVAALGARYDDDPRVAFVQLGSLGHWGEWHTWPYTPSSGAFPLVATSDLYVQHYIDAFANKQLGMRRPFAVARDNRLGLFNDIFGHDETDTWIDWIENGYVDDFGQSQPAMADFWQFAYSGGEFAWGDSARWLRDDVIDNTIRQAEESHTSWLGPSCPADLAAGGPEQANMDRLLKTLGYRYVVESVTHDGSVDAGDDLAVAFSWRNDGVAPFTFDWPLELSLVVPGGGLVASTSATDVDLRTLLPGAVGFAETLPVPAGLAGGTYTLCLAILDPHTGAPGIDLAIAGRRSDGRYAVSQIVVVSPCTDGDGDGYALDGGECGDLDCDDADAEVHPGAVEECNGKDDDCDGTADDEGAQGCTTFYYDRDRDSYGLSGNHKCLCAPTGHYVATRGGDCADTDGMIHPGAVESEGAGTCTDGKDNDCDGLVDTDPECESGGCGTAAIGVHGAKGLVSCLVSLLVPAVFVLGLRRRESGK